MYRFGWNHQPQYFRLFYSFSFSYFSTSPGCQWLSSKCSTPLMITYIVEIIFDFRATFGKHHFCHLHNVFSCKLFIMIWRTSIYAEHRMTLIAYVSSPFNVAGGRKPWNPNRQLKMLFRLLRWFSVGIAIWRWNRIHSTAAHVKIKYVCRCEQSPQIVYRIWIIVFGISRLEQPQAKPPWRSKHTLPWHGRCRDAMWRGGSGGGDGCIGHESNTSKSGVNQICKLQTLEYAICTTNHRPYFDSHS